VTTLAQGEENAIDRLNWFLTLGGIKFNAFEVGFRILDITGGLPGAQVFPVAAGTYEDVTNAPGRFDDGSYYAYDNGSGVGWTVPIAETLGLHRIEWRWKDTSSSSYQFGTEDFTVVAFGSSTAGDPLYTTVAEVRAAGVGDPPDDATILASLRLWQAFLDRACRQWFFDKELELFVDGTDSDALHFGVPIISVEELEINLGTDGNGYTMPTNEYAVYNERRYPPSRHNPRIKLIDRFAGERDIFTASDSYSRRRFFKGRRNQRIKGHFGFVEEDGSTPLLIKRALLLLVVEKLAKPPIPITDSTLIPPILSGVITEEWTDGHKLKYAQSGGTTRPRAPGLTGITDNQEVLNIIKLYKAPIGIATPAHGSYK